MKNWAGGILVPTDFEVERKIKTTHSCLRRLNSDRHYNNVSARGIPLSGKFIWKTARTALLIVHLLIAVSPLWAKTPVCCKSATGRYHSNRQLFPYRRFWSHTTIFYTKSSMTQPGAFWCKWCGTGLTSGASAVFRSINDIMRWVWRA